MELAFRLLLTNDAYLTSLVPASRISWQDSDQGASNPRIVFSVVSDVPGQDLQGESGYTQVRVQVDIYADTDVSLVAVREAVNSVLKEVKNQTVGSVHFFSIHRANRKDILQAPKGKQRGERRLTLDYHVHYKG